MAVIGLARSVCSRPLERPRGEIFAGARGAGKGSRDHCRKLVRRGLLRGRPLGASGRGASPGSAPPGPLPAAVVGWRRKSKERRRTVEVLGTLHTRRLVGERLRPSDLGDLRGLHQDPGVMATLSADGEVAPEGHTLEHLRGGLEHWERHGYGTWMFRDRAGGVRRLLRPVEHARRRQGGGRARLRRRVGALGRGVRDGDGAGGRGARPRAARAGGGAWCT